MQGAINASEGSVSIRLADEGGMEHINESLSGDASLDEVLADVSPGNWTIVVDYSGFVGTLAFSVNEAEDTGTGTQSQTTSTSTGPSPTETATTTSDSGSATGNTTSDGEDSPALPVIIVGAAVIAMAAVRRRW